MLLYVHTLDHKDYQGGKRVKQFDTGLFIYIYCYELQSLSTVISSHPTHQNPHPMHLSLIGLVRPGFVSTHDALLDGGFFFFKSTPVLLFRRRTAAVGKALRCGSETAFVYAVNLQF